MEQETLEQWAKELAYRIVSNGLSDIRDLDALNEMILRKLKKLANG